MKLKDLVVGGNYYHESRTGGWNQVGRRDITNRTGNHRVRLLGTELYSKDRHWYARRDRREFVPSTKQVPGTYVHVMFLAAEVETRRRGQDEEGYVSLASLRGEWGEVVRSTTETLAAREARNRELDEQRERENARLAEIVARAHDAGLEVVAPSGVTRREGKFTIKETDLVDFLDALTGTLESLTLVEH